MLDYSTYLKLDQLLSLQHPISEKPEHDEMLFIVIHQVYELWFKEVLHELEYLEDRLARRDTPSALHTLKRILTILKTLVAQIDVLETMTPVDFFSFRDRLETASGSESYQFREIEFTLGVKNPKALDDFPDGSEGRRRLDARLQSPTLWDAFLRYLSAGGFAVPDAALNRDISRPIEPNDEVQAILIDIYRNDPETAQLCERLVDLDEGFQEWRYRHVKMVERTIGTRYGTGGTTGVRYLMTTLFQPAFPDLWAIRTEL